MKHFGHANDGYRPPEDKRPAELPDVELISGSYFIKNNERRPEVIMNSTAPAEPPIVNKAPEGLYSSYANNQPKKSFYPKHQLTEKERVNYLSEWVEHPLTIKELSQATEELKHPSPPRKVQSSMNQRPLLDIHDDENPFEQQRQKSYGRLKVVENSRSYLNDVNNSHQEMTYKTFKESGSHYYGERRKSPLNNSSTRPLLNKKKVF